MALFGRNDPAHARQHPVQAQQEPAKGTDTTPVALQEIVVSGIRYSMQQSLALQRASVGTVSVVTAESIGKLPDKNVADALERLPGVDVSTAGATEGGFDEADRVSMRGLGPGLTLTTINGHLIGSGDWFVLNQSQEAGRSVDYTLLPAEIVKTIKVYKSPEASLVEGGVAGTVDVITRRPLDFKKPLTLEADAGVVYADKPGTKDPQFNALANWANADRTFGVMLQLFSETRHLRRDGQELLGYSQISPTLSSGAPNPIVAAYPNTANAYYPDLIGAAFFQQRRQRNGGMADVEWRPSRALTLNANFYTSKLEASNLNDNYLFWGSQIIGSENLVPTSATVQNGTLTSATWAPQAGALYGVYDQISRPDESASTNWGDFSAKWLATEDLTLSLDAGASFGHSRTPSQDVLETDPGVGSGASYTLHGTSTAANWNLGNTINTTPTPGGVPVAFGWIFGDQNIDVLDAERWGQIDADYALNRGMFTDIKFGARYSTHDRHLWGVIGQGPGCDGGALNWSDGPYACPDAGGSGLNPANYPTGFQNYPSNFGYGLGSGFPTGIWYFTPGQLAAYNLSYTYRDPVVRADWTQDFGLLEKDAAGYVQLDMDGTHWSANVGVRFVSTKESVKTNLGVPAGTPGAITTSAFGPYETATTNNTYTNVLPSANLKLDLTSDLVGRFDVAETMARPAYSALASSVALVVPSTDNNGSISVGSGTGGNPNLKPTKSTNVDAGLEWYFNPRSLLSGEAFYMRLRDYVSYGTSNESFMTFDNQHPNGFVGVYAVTSPAEADASVRGVELSYQQTFFENWGVDANYTYADGSATNTANSPGGDRVVGLSKSTYNLTGFYENRSISVRLAYNYRSSFFSGVDRSTAFTQMGEGVVDASINYDVNKWLSVSLNGMNLNNPELKYYGMNQTQPRAFYLNGRQYYLDFRFNW